MKNDDTYQRIVAGACVLGVLGFAVWLLWSPFTRPSDYEADTAFSGMLLLEEYQCRRAETSHLILRGVEDAYGPGNTETARVERSGLNQPVHFGTRDYDETGQDADLFDFFALPRNAVSGLFVIRMTPPAIAQNDALVLGSFTDNLELLPHEGGRSFNENPNEIDQMPGWSQRSDIYWAELENIELNSGESLIDFVRDESRDGVIDLMVGDDTIVDFAGIAYCTGPAVSNGLTFWVRSFETEFADRASATDESGPSYFTALCSNDPDALGRYCDPFIGDTPCENELPMICYRPGQHVYPGDEVWIHLEMPLGARFWSGGDFALTSAVAGDRFETIDDANGFCREAFGDDWRTADFHIDSQGYRFSGRGSAQYSGRAWVDIRDQPYGPCWAR